MAFPVQQLNYSKARRVFQSVDCPPDELRRLPGLYRRWELTEVFELHRNYQIEDAGTHADGTPLLAVYAGDPPPDAADVPSPPDILHGQRSGP